MIRSTRLATLARELAFLSGVGIALGLLRLALATDLPLVADEPSPEDAACGAEGEQARTLVQRIGIEDAQALLGQEQVTFVDARAAVEYAAGHVPGALSLPASDAAGILEVSSVPIPADGLVITYCEGLACEKSEYLGLLLRDRAGCEQVQVLEGGWNAWVSAGAQVVQGSDPGGDP